MHNSIEWYWESIPVGVQHAVSYDMLEIAWGMGKRDVRKMLADLSSFDNGDNYILIRSSKGKGFYRSDDPDEIADYKRECRSRALNTFAPLKKINRVLCALDAESINCSLFNNLQGVRQARKLSQAAVIMRLRARGFEIDVSLLSKIENGYVLPTPALLSALADIFDCEACELVAMERHAETENEAQSGLQVPLFWF